MVSIVATLVGSAILVSAPAREAHDAASLLRLVRAAVIPHEHLIETMPSDGRESARGDAIWKINQIGAPALPFLLPYVRAPPRGEWDSEQRARAIALVCGLGRAARSAFAALAPLVRARDAELRGTVAVCLAHLGVSPRLVAPLILPLLSDRDSFVVREAVEGARQLGPAAAPALARLRRLAYRGDVYVRVAAVAAIGNIGRAAWTARATLDVALDDAEADVQAAAAVALVKTRRSRRAFSTENRDRLLPFLLPRSETGVTVGERVRPPRITIQFEAGGARRSRGVAGDVRAAGGGERRLPHAPVSPRWRHV
jgi:HEAT repeat protein